MQQYFQNKKMYNEVYTEDITEEPTFSQNEYTDIVFAGYRWDTKAVIEGIKFDNCVFAKLGLRRSKFSHVNMAHSIFISCYFREASFDCKHVSGCRSILGDISEYGYTKGRHGVKLV